MISSFKGDALRWVRYDATYYVGLVVPPTEVSAEVEVPDGHVFVMFLDADGGSGAVVPCTDVEPYDPHDTDKASHPEAAMGMALAAQWAEATTTPPPLSAAERKEEASQQTETSTLPTTTPSVTNLSSTSQKKKSSRKETAAEAEEAAEETVLLSLATKRASSTREEHDSTDSLLELDEEDEDEEEKDEEESESEQDDESRGGEREGDWRRMEALAGLSDDHHASSSSQKKSPFDRRGDAALLSTTSSSPFSSTRFTSSISSSGPALVLPYVPRILNAYKALLHDATEKALASQRASEGIQGKGEREGVTQKKSGGRRASPPSLPVCNLSEYEVVAAVEAQLQAAQSKIRFLQRACKDWDDSATPEAGHANSTASTKEKEDDHPSQPVVDGKKEIEKKMAEIMEEATAIEETVRRLVRVVPTPVWRGELRSGSWDTLHTADDGEARRSLAALQNDFLPDGDLTNGLGEHASFIDPAMSHVYPRSLLLGGGTRGGSLFFTTGASAGSAAGGMVPSSSITAAVSRIMGDRAPVDPNASEKVRHYQQQYQRLQRQEQRRHHERHQRAHLWRALQSKSGGGGGASSSLGRASASARGGGGQKRFKADAAVDFITAVPHVLSHWNKAKGLLAMDRVSDVQLVKPQGYFSVKYSSSKRRLEDAALRRIIAWSQKNSSRGHGVFSSHSAHGGASHASSSRQTESLSSRDVEDVDQLLRRRLKREQKQQQAPAAAGGEGRTTRRATSGNIDDDDEEEDTASNVGLMAWYREKANYGLTRNAGLLRGRHGPWSSSSTTGTSTAPVLYRFHDQPQVLSFTSGATSDGHTPSDLLHPERGVVDGGGVVDPSAAHLLDLLYSGGEGEGEGEGIHQGRGNPTGTTSALDVPPPTSGEGEEAPPGGGGGGAGVSSAATTDAVLLPPLELPGWSGKTTDGSSSTSSPSSTTTSKAGGLVAPSVEALFQLKESELVRHGKGWENNVHDAPKGRDTEESSVWWMSAFPQDDDDDDETTDGEDRLSHPPRRSSHTDTSEGPSRAPSDRHDGAQQGSTIASTVSASSDPFRSRREGRAMTWRDGAKQAIVTQLSLYVKKGYDNDDDDEDGDTSEDPERAERRRRRRARFPPVLPLEDFKAVASLLLHRATEAESERLHISLKLAANNQRISFTEKMAAKLKKSVDNYIYRHYIVPTLGSLRVAGAGGGAGAATSISSQVPPPSSPNASPSPSLVTHDN